MPKKRNTYNVKLSDREIELIRTALISKESEERCLMNSYIGTDDYYKHYENKIDTEKLRDKITLLQDK
jgi:hypothetical protein